MRPLRGPWRSAQLSQRQHDSLWMVVRILSAPRMAAVHCVASTSPC
jgi:hypothetical protein